MSIIVSLEPKHNKIMKGGAIQLSKSHLSGTCGHRIEMPLKMRALKRLQKAQREGRQARLSLADVDMEQIDGEGFKKFWGNLKSGAKAVKGVYTKHLKKHLGPLLENMAKQTLDQGISALNTAVPGISKLTDKIPRDKLIDKFGDLTGAYGMYGYGMAAPYIIQGGQAYPVIDTRQSFLMPLHPAMLHSSTTHPGFGEMGSYVPPQYGGSFRAI